MFNVSHPEIFLLDQPPRGVEEFYSLEIKLSKLSTQREQCDRWQYLLPASANGKCYQVWQNFPWICVVLASCTCRSLDGESDTTSLTSCCRDNVGMLFGKVGEIDVFGSFLGPSKNLQRWFPEWMWPKRSRIVKQNPRSALQCERQVCSSDIALVCDMKRSLHCR